MASVKTVLDGICAVLLFTVLINIVGYNWISPALLRCGPDGLQVSGFGSHANALLELCREALHQPRPIHVDQKSVVCWKKMAGEWQWMPCDKGELSKRQEKITEEIQKQKHPKGGSP